MFKYGLATVVFVYFSGLHAEAQILTGNGLGKDCFEAVAFSRTAKPRDEYTCTKAIEEGQLSQRDKAATLTNRGIVRMRLGKLDLALDDLAAARTIRPDLGEAYINEGAALVLVRRYDDAIAQLLKAIDYEAKDQHVAYFNLGLAREALGDVEGAYFDFSRALELRPGWERAINELMRFDISSTGLDPA